MFGQFWQNCCSFTFQFSVLLVLFLALGYLGFSASVWCVSFFIAFWVLGFSYPFLLIFAAFCIVVAVPAIRKSLISQSVMNLLNKLKLLPTISATEKTALEAGSTWVEGQLFSGSPDFHQILQEKYPELYDMLDKDFPFYQDSYTKKMDKEAAEVLKEDAHTIKKMAE